MTMNGPANEAPPEKPLNKQQLAARRIGEFMTELRPFTPRVYIAYAIIGVNVALWIAQVALGVNALNPSIQALLTWGADYGARTIGGEWWRLVTATFLHIGVIHLLVNMIALWQIGPFMERLVGNASFFVLYFFAGIGGSLLSIAHNPQIVSAGASGAIFGLYGALFGFLLRARGTLPKDIFQQLAKTGGMFIVYNLLYGASQGGIDQGAHIGGLIAGFVGGLVVGHPIEPDAFQRRTSRALSLAALGVLAFTGAAVALPKPSGFYAELDRYPKMEARLIARVNDTAVKNEHGEMTDAEFAKVLRDEVLPEWRASIARFQGARGLDGKPEQLRAKLTQYMQARADSWQAIVDGVTKNDPSLIKEATAKREEADELLRELSQMNQ